MLEANCMINSKNGVRIYIVLINIIVIAIASGELAKNSVIIIVI